MLKAKNFTLKDSGELVFEDNWTESEQRDLEKIIEEQKAEAEAEIPTDGSVAPIERDKPVS